ncbi:MAG: VOC family protein [Eubacteriales bacterium]
MKLKNILFVVADIEKSKGFYRDIFGLQVITAFDHNVMLTEGLVLQERNTWESLLGKEVHIGGHDAELYFEENNMDRFMEKLVTCEYEIKIINQMEHEWGQRVIRLYDPDMHVIEVSEAMDYVIRRLIQSGMPIEDVVEKTGCTWEYIEEMM